MKIIGHRGAKGLAPENTLASFAKALEHDVDEIECDIRVTKDGVPVMEHDERMGNPGGERLKVIDCTYEELIKHKPELPTLEACIRAVNRAVPMYLEVKPGVPTAPVVACIQQFLDEGWEATDFKFGSFDYNVLKALHDALPQIPLIVIESWSGIRAASRARRLGATHISMDQRWIWSGYIRAVRRSGLELYTYTLDNPRKARRWARHGLNAAVTDYPDNYQSK
ncbi:MAG TPA: glycerophosphodiester phosphodiesterase [Candidatus Saccharimonadales bacterium]